MDLNNAKESDLIGVIFEIEAKDYVQFQNFLDKYEYQLINVTTHFLPGLLDSCTHVFYKYDMRITRKGIAELSIEFRNYSRGKDTFFIVSKYKL